MPKKWQVIPTTTYSYSLWIVDYNRIWLRIVIVLSHAKNLLITVLVITYNNSTDPLQTKDQGNKPEKKSSALYKLKITSV